MADIDQINEAIKRYLSEGYEYDDDRELTDLDLDKNGYTIIASLDAITVLGQAQDMKIRSMTIEQVEEILWSQEVLDAMIEAGCDKIKELLEEQS